VVMTSNLGAAEIVRPSTMGFAAPPVGEADYQSMRVRLEDQAKRAFKPEFLNRVDEIVVFRQLGKTDIGEIVSLEVAKIQERLATRGIRLEYGDPVRDFLIDKGYKPEYGARQLRRVVEQYIEDPLSEEILRGALPEGARIVIEAGDGKLLFRPNEVPEKAVAESEG